ncbi:MAG: circularly permuted type 2 ATP-grasp protein [Gammaproteobacteria bacterium]|nr:circularly permuted type 2 ATP-grasp protein [Gammaproteobacteria bacterium]NIN61998.1 circularly permuted type 2 ATP-grasp protein [Gammaproteobacteria bacterium]NIO62077.1 circularly permuted type 2 ATP-grasp protein [Gammaproteobacteria bacterium]NIQ08313.1 circularly permuted type 2 ATP-grasp protein [Gammaproteobacteria bacterium]NIQ19789.1 circularly permuted type 2 ATP-grasp protein [Gammaproteobacteria bacterium]
MTLKNYNSSHFYDELLTPDGKARPGSGRLISYLKKTTNDNLQKRKHAAELAIKTMGITFTVYSEGENIDREWPYDIIPRVISLREWEKVEAGLKQRLTALNHFINDLYNEQKILKDKIIPRDLLKSSKNYREQCRGIKPVYGVWAHICGTDLVRDSDGTIYVLEDNLRVPSGVSYMIENRKVTKRVFPELFEDYNILPMGDYPSQLFDTLSSISPRPMDYPEVAVLTPGIYNSAYFEHSFLAQQMGAELVEGSDLVVGDDECVYMKTIGGLSRVDVIYRRIDDLFIDPEVFNKDSLLGVPGLIRAWKKGNVALANAPGAGVADDKVVYTYVPDMIRYYLDEDAILPNVPSFSCDNEKERKHVLANLENLVVKPANESGGYGMLIGPKSSKRERAEFARLIKARPRNYIGQPVISISTVPTLTENSIEPRHVDLRPFILHGDRMYVTAGGLTRVALVKGSLVVNSSQGGGSKDTWIVAPNRD